MATANDRSAGTLIRMHRDRAGLSQRQLAEAAGVTVSYVSDIENNRKQPSRPETIRALASALGVRADELFVGVGRVPDDLAEQLRTDIHAVDLVRAVLALDAGKQADLLAFIERASPGDELRWMGPGEPPS